MAGRMRPVATDHPSTFSGLGALTAPSPSPALDDVSIVIAVLEGDREAFRVLVDREVAGVVRTADRILGDHDEAEDVAQEAFVSAYRALATWRADGPFGAWIARIAVRIAIRRVARRRELPWAQPSQVPDDEPTDAVAAAADEPERTAVRGEQARDVRRAVAALEEPYREVVALRFFADRSLDEIATITGRPLGTVKTHLRRGLIRLRGQLDGGPG
jgi:RNA polymerase sigma-70 factor, ECF subfamily